mgnify:CR=1 FL=1
MIAIRRDPSGASSIAAYAADAPSPAEMEAYMKKKVNTEDPMAKLLSGDELLPMDS